MAEEDEKPVKKGGNKVVVIVISVVMLLTGGFFGLKMRGGAGSKPKLELGDIVQIHEFLVNINRDDSKYLRTEISVQCVKGFSKDKLDPCMDAIEDAMTDILRQQTIKDLDIAKSDKLKKELAEAANDAYYRSTPDAKAPDPYINAPKDWDSQTGPILKVFFTSFAFQ